MIRGCVSLLLKLLGWVFSCNFTRKLVDHDGIKEEKAYEALKTAPWSPQSWKAFPVKHSPPWLSQEELQGALTTVRSSAPLVDAGDVLRLREELSQVARGERFLLQGGDCAEEFSAATPTVIGQKVELLVGMSQLIAHTLPCTPLGRIAGQYAKPRSSQYEGDGKTLNFFGENVNGMELGARHPDPQRLIQGYKCAQETLVHVKNALSDIGNNNREGKTGGSLPISISPQQTPAQLFTSHEALVLDYEDALTRSVNGKWFNLSAHFVWIGDRTRQVDHGHLEYVRGIQNPIGIKVGPSMGGEEIVKVLQLVWPNPEQSPGRVTLITRYGQDKVEKCLGEHIRAVQAAGYGDKVVWISDPCHGNTVSTSNGYKTRDFDKVFEEIRLVHQTHVELGSRLGGVHLEMTGEDVTECIGGPEGLTELDLPRAYKTLCDPRLNRQQGIHMAKLVAQLI